MNWKIFFTVSISGLFILFPANILGCASWDEDPYDYFTSFFSHKLVTHPGSNMFFYTSLAQFYNEEEPDNKISISQRMVQEWKAYCKNQAGPEDVQELVFNFSIENLEIIKQGIQNANPKAKKMVDSNAMANMLFTKKDIEAVDYLLLARATEKFSNTEDWDAVQRPDSLVLKSYENYALEKINTSKNDFLKQRLAFQLCKIAFYSGRYSAVLKWFDRYFKNEKISSVQQLALSYKAGSEYRLNKNKEAAYSFSKLFANDWLNRKNIYLGFLWSTNWAGEELEDEFAAQCSTKKDEVVMRTLFAMYGTKYRLNSIMNLYGLDKANPMLPLLVSREVHKLEENVLSPMLDKKKGGKSYYYSYSRYNDESQDHSAQLTQTRLFVEKMGAEASGQKSFYYSAAAHLAFISGDFNKTKSLLKLAEGAKPSAELKDQLHMIRLLVAVNEIRELNSTTEAKLLPSLKWLKAKAGKDEEYAQFYRNFFSQLMAEKYADQKNKAMMALSYGMSDRYNSYSGYGVDYLRDEMDIEDILNLYRVFTSQTPTSYQKFLMANSSIKKNHITDLMGTSYLRSHNFPKAIEWLQRSSLNDTLVNDSWDEKTGNVDPFFDYVNDSERYDRFSKTPWTKLSLAKKMLELEKQLLTTKDKEKKAGLYYKLATAYYNISYYGNSYSALVYYRPTSEWNTGEYAAQWEKEYYGVNKAKTYFEKAYRLTGNKEFRAACYFLFLKCDQRQVITDPYTWGTDSTFLRFKYNRYFPKFQKEFGKTKYFEYVYERCSYLRDFVEKSKVKSKK
jgi:hypothetical protein